MIHEPLLQQILKLSKLRRPAEWFDDDDEDDDDE